jgi:hypothetical protein
MRLEKTGTLTTDFATSRLVTQRHTHPSGSRSNNAFLFYT